MALQFMAEPVDGFGLFTHSSFRRPHPNALVGERSPREQAPQRDARPTLVQQGEAPAVVSGLLIPNGPWCTPTAATDDSEQDAIRNNEARCCQGQKRASL